MQVGSANADRTSEDRAARIAGLGATVEIRARMAENGTVHDRYVPATGDRATVAGTYKCLGCGHAIVLAVGDEFPRCTKCTMAVNWALLERTEG